LEAVWPGCLEEYNTTQYNTNMADKDGKKRKRQSNGEPAPNKKSHIDANPSGTAKVAISENGLPPVISSAPGLTVPQISFKAYSKASSKAKDDSQLKPSTHSVILHSTKHPRLDYTATPSSVESPVAHYLAVYDPKAQKLQIVPSHHLSLRSTLRSETQEVKENEAKKTMAQQRVELGQEFGTKKSKKAIASKTLNAITKGNEDGKSAEVQTAILDTNDQNQTELAEAALAAKPIPKPNMAAESVEEVYPLSTLIPPGDLRLVLVKEWQDKARAEEAILVNNRFSATRLGPIGKGDDVDKLKALRYLNLLLDFNASLGAAGRAGKKVPKKDVLSQKLSDYPDNLVDSVRRRFSENNELNKWHQDYLYTHMCALSLYVDHYVTDISNLKDDLRLENKQVGQYFHELGCRVGPPTEKERENRGMSKAQAAATRIAKLKLPLDFPKPRMMRKR
jgi:DNA-directed RNA polymerase I subunit RPA49